MGKQLTYEAGSQVKNTTTELEEKPNEQGIIKSQISEFMEAV